MKYRVMLSYISDGHFKTPPDKIAFESNSLKDCYDFIEDYKEKNPDAWVEFYIQKSVIKITEVYERI